MKLDYDCVRDVLLVIEEVTTITDDFALKDVLFINIVNKLESYSDKEIFYTTRKLEEAGFILTRNDNDTRKNSFDINDYYIKDITFKGHQYINSIRDEKIWSKVKQTVKTLTFSIILQAAEYYILSNLGVK